MITQSLIPEQLKSFNYYKNKLPLYLRQSNTFQEHFRIWYEILVGDGSTGVVGNGEILLNMLNIFSDDYFTFLATIEGSSATDTSSDILDKIANLFGESRYCTVSYQHNGTDYNEQLTLTNEELLILIKARIVQNYCDGSLEQINAYYSDIGLNIKVQTSDDAATANLYLIFYEERPLSNIDKMFLSDKLTIRSMGIMYRQQLLVPSNILIWDSINEAQSNGWGGTYDGVTYTGGWWVI